MLAVMTQLGSDAVTGLLEFFFVTPDGSSMRYQAGRTEYFTVRDPAVVHCVEILGTTISHKVRRLFSVGESLSKLIQVTRREGLEAWITKCHLEEQTRLRARTPRFLRLLVSRFSKAFQLFSSTLSFDSSLSMYLSKPYNNVQSQQEVFNYLEERFLVEFPKCSSRYCVFSQCSVSH